MEWQEIGMKQNSDDWYKIRLGRFTASRIGELFTEPRSKKAREAGELSKGTKNYIAKVVTERRHKRPVVKPLEHVSAIAYGNTYEPEAVKWYEVYHEIETQPTGFFAGGEWLGASPDRLIGEDGVLEIKCCYEKAVHTERIALWLDTLEEGGTGNDFLKSYNKLYYYQIQFQMYATQRRWGHWVSYDPDLVENDLIAAQSMLLIEVEFDSSIDFEGKTKAAIEHAKRRIEQLENMKTPIVGRTEKFKKNHGIVRSKE